MRIDVAQDFGVGYRWKSRCKSSSAARPRRVSASAVGAIAPPGIAIRPGGAGGVASRTAKAPPRPRRGRRAAQRLTGQMPLVHLQRGRSSSGSRSLSPGPEAHPAIPSRITPPTRPIRRSVTTSRGINRADHGIPSVDRRNGACDRRCRNRSESGIRRRFALECRAGRRSRRTRLPPARRRTGDIAGGVGETLAPAYA